MFDLALALARGSKYHQLFNSTVGHAELSSTPPGRRAAAARARARGGGAGTCGGAENARATAARAPRRTSAVAGRLGLRCLGVRRQVLRRRALGRGGRRPLALDGGRALPRLPPAVHPDAARPRLRPAHPDDRRAGPAAHPARRGQGHVDGCARRSTPCILPPLPCTYPSHSQGRPIGDEYWASIGSSRSWTPTTSARRCSTANPWLDCRRPARGGRAQRRAQRRHAGGVRRVGGAALRLRVLPLGVADGAGRVRRS